MPSNDQVLRTGPVRYRRKLETLLDSYHLPDGIVNEDDDDEEASEYVEGVEVGATEWTVTE